MAIMLKLPKPIMLSAHWGQKVDGPLWYLKDGPMTYTFLVGITHIRTESATGLQLVIGPLLLAVATTCVKRH